MHLPSENTAIADFAFAWEGASEAIGPWDHLQVVHIRGTEAISRLYRYEIGLLAREPAPDVDPEELIQARATLRIATRVEPPARLVHGIIAEAEEIGSVHGGTLYRVVLVPPLARAMYRTRCRIFLEKTTRQIIDAVLLGDPELRRQDSAAAPPPISIRSSPRPASCSPGASPTSPASIRSLRAPTACNITRATLPSSRARPAPSPTPAFGPRA